MVLDKLSNLAKNVSDKTNEAIEITKLNSKISSEQNAISAVMKQIGEFYYNKYAETGTADEEIIKFCETIDGHNAAINEAKREIARIKAEDSAVPGASGSVTCSACGAANATDRKFCAECGGKLEAETRTCACGAKAAPGVKFCGDCGAPL